MKKILIFGATGDTGKYLVDYLQAHLDLTIYSILATGRRATSFFEKRGIQYYQVDVSDKNAFIKLPRDVYAVVDLAGLMPARMQGYDPQQYIDVNITGTLNILEYCRLTNADRILYTQSFGDIKDWGEVELNLTVEMPCNFKYNTDHTIYVMSKNFGVDLLKNYQAMYGIKIFIFRLPTIYLWSPVDTYYVDGKVQKIAYRELIDKACRGEPIEIWGNPSRVKDMVYVKDFCQMLCKALQVEGILSGHYNVGTGQGTSLEDQIKGMIKVFGRENNYSKILYNPNKPNAPQYIMDISSAVKDLSYWPKYDYISMLQDFKKEMKMKRFI